MILNNIRPDRQMVMFSATFPPRVEQLARDKIQMPLIIMVGGRAEVAGEVDQHVEVINKEDKWFRLLQILGEWESKGSILIFVDKQEKCDQVLDKLCVSMSSCWLNWINVDIMLSFFMVAWTKLIENSPFLTLRMDFVILWLQHQSLVVDSMFVI